MLSIYFEIKEFGNISLGENFVSFVFSFVCNRKACPEVKSSNLLKCYDLSLFVENNFSLFFKDIG